MGARSASPSRSRMTCWTWKRMRPLWGSLRARMPRPERRRSPRSGAWSVRGRCWPRRSARRSARPRRSHVKGDAFPTWHASSGAVPRSRRSRLLGTCAWWRTGSRLAPRRSRLLGTCAWWRTGSRLGQRASTTCLVPRALSLPRREAPPLWETPRAACQSKEDTRVVLPDFSLREESPEETEGGALRCGSPQRSRTSATREDNVLAPPLSEPPRAAYRGGHAVRPRTPEKETLSDRDFSFCDYSERLLARGITL